MVQRKFVSKGEEFRGGDTPSFTSAPEGTILLNKDFEQVPKEDAEYEGTRIGVDAKFSIQPTLTGNPVERAFSVNSPAATQTFQLGDVESLTSGWVRWNWNLSKISSTLAVVSEYDSEMIKPSVGSHEIRADDTLSFSAPPYIYLNRHRQQLEDIDKGSYSLAEDNVAYYRQECKGYTFAGGSIAGTNLEFTLDITKQDLENNVGGLVVTWVWEEQYAVFIDSATGSSGVGNPSPIIGRDWYKKNEQLTASIDRVINSEGDGFRFETVSHLREEYSVSETLTAVREVGSVNINVSNISRTEVIPGAGVFIGTGVIDFDDFPNELDEDYKDDIRRLITEKRLVVIVDGWIFEPTLTSENSIFIIGFGTQNLIGSSRLDLEFLESEALSVETTSHTFTNEPPVQSRRTTGSFIIDKPMRIEWSFTGQVRYRFDAGGGELSGRSDAFDGAAFVKVYEAGSTTQLDTSVGDNGIVWANGTNTDVWIDSGPAGSDKPGRKVEVGAFYRTVENCDTLGDFPTPLGGDLADRGTDVSGFGDQKIADQAGNMRLARTKVIGNAERPTEIHWFYKPTVFRAIVPLGQGFDVGGDSYDLVPRFCGFDRDETARPKLATSGAGTGDDMAFITTVEPDGGSDGKSARALRWDSVSKKLFPVHPGSYEVTWPDQDDRSKSYKIEIVSGFPDPDNPDPDKEVRLSSEAEYAHGEVGGSLGLEGERKGTAPGYQRTIKLPGIDTDAGFPAASDATPAHYYHLYGDVSGQTPPSLLDLSTVDEWKFQDLTFAESNTGAAADKAETGVPFTATGGGRSVLLYSYRPNPDEIADGKLDREKLAVRIVKSEPVDSNMIGRDDPQLVLGRHGLEFGGGSATQGKAYGVIGSDAQTDSGDKFVVDFWLNSKDQRSSPSVILEGCETTEGSTSVSCESTAEIIPGMTVVGTNIPAGARVASVPSSSTFELDIASTGTRTTGTGLTLTAEQTLADCSVTEGSTLVTFSGNVTVVEGMSIQGLNIPPGAIVESVTDTQNFILNRAAIASGTALSFTASVTLTDCITEEGSLSVVTPGDATGSLVAGMRLLGSNLADGTSIESIDIDGETLTISTPATGSTTTLQPLSLTASNKPITVFTTDGGRLSVTLDPGGSTATAHYRGLEVTQPLPRAGASWRHHVLHVFTYQLFGFKVTVLDYYIDGVRAEAGLYSFLLSPGAASWEISSSVTPQSLRFGVNAEPDSGIVLDQFRLYDLPGDNKQYLDAGDLRVLRTERDAGFRGESPLLWFDFETAPSDGRFPNQGSVSDVGVGLVTAAALASGAHAPIGLQEVATRIDSTLDNAGFGGSGYVINEKSNYNADIYQREADVGQWGPIFPVNASDKIEEELQVAYYENPYLVDPEPHPNVAWPYVVTAYKEVSFPADGPHKDKAIYIASRIGSEGVDRTGRPQEIYDLSRYADLQIYNQPLTTAPGFNRNEEHALVAPSGRAALKIKNKGEDIPNNPPLAAFALQDDLNSETDNQSEPWVLVQVDNLETGEPEMHAYQVFQTRDRLEISDPEPFNNLVAGDLIEFPRPDDDVIADPDDGLAYEPAEKPEDRILTIDPSKTYNFEYKFDYPVVAGDLLIPPYPLNLVIGNVSMPAATGGNREDQRALWFDVSHNPWIVSGGGAQFFYQYFYPLRSDFYPPSGATEGTVIAWMPEVVENLRSFTSDSPDADKAEDTAPLKVVYTSQWGTDYPKLKRGETLTYQGGEYFNENPGSEGLPALVAMGAAEVVFDSATKTMVLTDDNIGDYSARIVRPLDRYEADFTVADMGAAGFTPASGGVLVIAERWYFKDLPGSLSKRFYFDSLAEKLVFRGYLNGKDGGDPDLTAGPDPINFLEPNLLTETEKNRLLALPPGDPGDWGSAVEEIYNEAMNPMMVRNGPNSFVTGQYLAGIKESPLFTSGLGSIEEYLQFSISGLNGAELVERKQEFERLLAEFREGERVWNFEPRENTYYITEPRLRRPSEYAHLDSFGVGAALVPNPQLLTMPTDGGSRYITIAENSRSELAGAPVSLHIIEIIPDRYRGAIQVIEGTDAFSEKIDLQHNGEFGANTGNLHYEWWIRDAAPLDQIDRGDGSGEVKPDGTLEDVAANGEAAWELYAEGTGLHSITFEGSPNVVLADKLVLMRYKHLDELDEDAEREDSWNLVPFEVSNAAEAWTPSLEFDDETEVVRDNDGEAIVTGPAPFQWAGAANSPQLQASGAKRYVPQLVMGWVKRVLDRINPYEARYSDFFGNESPATYSSQIQIAGAPFAGKVALNPDKNVIENVGLIELYETVLQRARELSIDNSSNGNATTGVQQALLLAATRLSVLYELLGSEAYSDAQDSTIKVTDLDGLASVASYTHAFQNMEADLLHEELALLRGTDFLKSYPVYNRIFWNYAKGLGEAAYNVNYNIYDEDANGFINEDDARALYPQGHGDAWGHFVRAQGMHYELLQSKGFSWKTRSELYSLMQNVLEVDFLDEKTFANLAARKARTGRDIVRATYRKHYTQDPDGQWQGYTDGADPARAWGVSEWATRAGQSAYFDWGVANALLPEQAESPIGTPENLDRLERLGAEDDIGEVAAGLHEIQVAMDEANGGGNPLGFDADSLALDLNLEFYENASGGDRRSHFEQIYQRALTASGNALATLEFATAAENKLRALGDDTNALIGEAFSQDLDYRNRLIEIFGTPYTGQIGFGKAYPEGYEGPDTLLYAYLDRTTIDQIVPSGKSSDPNTIDFDDIENRAPTYVDMKVKNQIPGVTDDDLSDLFQSLDAGELGYDNIDLLEDAVQTYIDGNDYTDPLKTLNGMPVHRAADYAFQSGADWGGRTSYGSVQRTLEEMLSEEMALKAALDDYAGFLGDFETLVLQLEHELEFIELDENYTDAIVGIRAGLSTAKLAYESTVSVLELGNKAAITAMDITLDALPDTNGLSNDLTFAGAATTRTIAEAVTKVSDGAKVGFDIAFAAAELLAAEITAVLEREQGRLSTSKSILGMLAAIENHTGDNGPKLATIGQHLQTLETLRQEYFTTLSEGFRLLKERESFNTGLAAAVQSNRYNDMVVRLTRNEAMSKYQSAFNHAARYAWLAARAYDYETSLDPGDPASASQVFDKIVKERQLGLWSDGEPQVGQGGLAEILAQLNGNFGVLKGQLGIDNPQSETGKISLRDELFRIDDGTPAGQDRWEDVIKARIVPDLTTLPEFTRYCRPFSTLEEGAQPGIVIRFSSEINNGVNFFGNSLMAGDHAYSTANFATKIRGVGVWLEDYNDAGLATTPRAYLVPVGNDYLRTSSDAQPTVRMWNVVEQRIPTPYVINQSQITSPGYIPSLDGLDGGFGELRRHGNFRMYHDDGGEGIDESELIMDTRLIGRSLWNSDWMLIIPGAGLDANPMEGLTKFADKVSDIKLHFLTYSHQGQ